MLPTGLSSVQISAMRPVRLGPFCTEAALAGSAAVTARARWCPALHGMSAPSAGAAVQETGLGPGGGHGFTSPGGLRDP